MRRRWSDSDARRERRRGCITPTSFQCLKSARMATAASTPCSSSKARDSISLSRSYADCGLHRQRVGNAWTPHRKPRRCRQSARPEVSAAARSLLTGRFVLGNATLAEADFALESGPTTAAASAVLPGQAQFSSVESDRRHYFESVARIGQQAAGALVYAHQRGV